MKQEFTAKSRIGDVGSKRGGALLDQRVRFGGEPPCGYESAIHSLPCRKCTSSEGAQQKCCAERPLEKYAGKALAVLEWIERNGKGQG
jgi:hypothetical protein